LPKNELLGKATGAAKSQYTLAYRAHLEGSGDTGWSEAGEFCGTRGAHKRLEAIWIELTRDLCTITVHSRNLGGLRQGDGMWAGSRGQGLVLEAFQIRSNIANLGFRYMAQFGNRIDPGWHENGEFVGSPGSDEPLVKFAIELTGAASSQYRLRYRAHVEDLGDSDWLEAGQFHGPSKPVEAIWIELTRDLCTITVQVERLGELRKGDGMWAGSRGQGLRLEAFGLRSKIEGLGFRYMGHVEGQGDTAWRDDGEFVGTPGKAKALEGFAIELTGAAASHYTLDYSAQVKDELDTPWCQAGEFCGTRGAPQRLEAIWIELTRKP
jgi:uncharacterized protein YjdB